MKTKIIGISGKIGSGKSTLSEMIEIELKKQSIPVDQRFFAMNVKKIHELLTGHAGYTQKDKNHFLDAYGFTVGEGLQKVGDGLRELYHSDVWILSTLTNLEPYVITIINDCRYPNEANLIRAKEGIVIRLNGDPANVRENSLRDHNHSSETALDNYKDFDIIFDNNKGIEELKNFAKKIVQDFCS